MYYMYNENVIFKEYFNPILKSPVPVEYSVFYERVITYETSHYINIEFGD